MGTIAPGTQGKALSDSPADGAPVMIGGIVDNVAPAVAGEGDVRNFRVSTRGELLFGGTVALTGDGQGDPVSISDDVGNDRPLAVVIFGFNGTTFDRLRGDTNGLQIIGAAASDAPEAGNPVQIGGSVDNTAPAGAAEGDVRRIRTTPLGEQLIAGLGPSDAFDGVAAGRLMVSVDDAQRPLGTCVYGRAPDGNQDRIRTLGDVSLDGLGQLCATPAVPGAGVVVSRRVSFDNDNVRFTPRTPAAGNRIRIIGVIMSFDQTTPSSGEVYFGTGAAISTATDKAIAEAFLVSPERRGAIFGWPDGAGPVGAVDEVLSVRPGTAVVGTMAFIIFLREE